MQNKIVIIALAFSGLAGCSGATLLPAVPVQKIQSPLEKETAEA